MSLGSWVKKRAKAATGAVSHATRAVTHNPVAAVVGKATHAAASIAMLPTQAVIKGTTATVAAATNARWAKKADAAMGREYRRTLSQAKVTAPAAAMIGVALATGNAAGVAAGAARIVGTALPAQAPAPVAATVPQAVTATPGSAAAAGGAPAHKRFRDVLAEWIGWLITGKR